ncbi:MAG: DsbA family protein [bacterium]
MFKLFKKPKLPITLFIIVSIASLLAVMFLYSVFMYMFRISFNQYAVEQKTVLDEYYLKEAGSADPFVTKVLNLEDILAGPIISTDDPQTSNIKTPVNIIVFADFKCLYYAENKNIIDGVLKKYKNQVKLIWKDYPDSDKDSSSYQAARAARCANEQGKFWQYQDSLFNNILNLNQETFEKIAQETGLNLDEFKNCQASGKVDILIDNNIEEAQALGIDGVPFIYVNSQEMMGEIDQDVLEKMVEIELNRIE